MAHVGLKDRFELPHSVARLFNVVKILGSAVTAVRSVVNIVYDFVVGGNVNDHAESVNATSREEVDRFVAFVDYPRAEISARAEFLLYAHAL